MASALASALTGRAVYKHIAMTGEITLRGRVLPIGGLKEKLLAAQRAGVTKVLLPLANAPDLREVPAAMKAAGAKDPIEQKVFQSTASLQEIYDFYDKQLTQKNWQQSKNMPGIQDGILLTGYEIGTTSLVIGAVDATQLGSPDVIVYLAKGTT